MKKGIARIFLPLILISISCSLPGSVLGPTLTPSPTETITPTATTYSQYPYIEVPIQAVVVSDDDGSRATPITYDKIKAWVDKANEVWAPAGIRFLFTPQDMSTLANTLVNGLAGPTYEIWPAQRAAANQVAAQYPGKLVVFFRWGLEAEPTTGGFTWIDMNFVVMPIFEFFVCGHQNIEMLAHEIGHYFGLPHTFPELFHSLDEAVTYFSDNGNDPNIFNFDGFSDTLPDPYIEIPLYQCENTASVTLNGIEFELPRDNLMSYYDRADTLSEQQNLRARWFLEKRMENDMAMPVNLDAPTPLEAEDLAILDISGCTSNLTNMANWGRDRWMGDDVLFLSSSPNCSVTFGLSVQVTGRYRLDAYLFNSQGGGRAQVLLDGVPVGEPVDFYGFAIMPSGRVTIGTFDLAAQVHSLTFKVVGKNDLSVNYRLGLDCFSLVPVP